MKKSKRATAGEKIAMSGWTIKDLESLRSHSCGAGARKTAKKIDVEIRRAVREAWMTGRACEYCVQVASDTSVKSAIVMQDRIAKKYRVKL